MMAGEKKTLVLGTSLRGDVINSREIMSDEKQQGNENLKEKMELQFNQVHLKHISHVKVKNHNRKPKGTLHEYEADIA